MKEIEITRVNWISCPKCKYRYHVGPQLLRAAEPQSICPKCRFEFDPTPYVEPRHDEVSAADLV